MEIKSSNNAVLHIFLTFIIIKLFLDYGVPSKTDI